MSAAPGVTVVEHQGDDPAGLIGDWLDARGIAWTITRAGEPYPDPAGPEAIITLGSSLSAYAAEPDWIARHGLLLRDALAAETPVLGVCFGAQALALAGGGEVIRAQRPEVGWVQSESEQEELRGTWLSWHLDAIAAAPPGAVPLARSADALQAFRLGRSLAIQFHPEVTSTIWGWWAQTDPELAQRHAGDPAEFAAGLQAREDDLRERVFILLDWWYRSLVKA